MFLTAKTIRRLMKYNPPLIDIITPAESNDLLRNILKREKEKMLSGKIEGSCFDLTLDSVHVHDKNCFFKSDNFIINCRLMDPYYPDCEKILPQQSPLCQIKINREELLVTLKRSLIFSVGYSKSIQIKWEYPKLQIISGMPPDGVITSNLITKGKDNINFDLKINCQYLIDAVNAIDSEWIKIDYHGMGRPFLLHPDQEESYFNLVMPLRDEK